MKFQAKLYRNALKAPKELKHCLSKKTFDKARIYGLDQQMFGICKTLLIDVLLASLELYFGYIAYLWQLSINAAKYCNSDTESEIVISGMFMVVSSVMNFAKDMRFKVYKTFVLEEKHSVNKQTMTKEGKKYLFLFIYLFICIMN